jgi:uncharacterized XkdX family phage protein
MAKKKTYSTLFPRIRNDYKRKWANKDQLREYVELGAITASEFEEITGESYD